MALDLKNTDSLSAKYARRAPYGALCVFGEVSWPMSGQGGRVFEADSRAV